MQDKWQGQGQGRKPQCSHDMNHLSSNTIVPAGQRRRLQIRATPFFKAAHTIPHRPFCHGTQIAKPTPHPFRARSSRPTLTFRFRL